VTGVQTCALPIFVGANSESQLEQIIGAVSRAFPHDLPYLLCEEENLINPSNWAKL
jgi:hypothetical protein